jgi:hypothetical protein
VGKDHSVAKTDFSGVLEYHTAFFQNFSLTLGGGGSIFQKGEEKH